MKDKQKYCDGCKDDFYNNQNPYGINACWHLKSARLVLKKKVGVQQTPPWNQKPIEVLSCYSQNGFIFVGKDQKF